jgi:hypothetical protein
VAALLYEQVLSSKGSARRHWRSGASSNLHDVRSGKLRVAVELAGMNQAQRHILAGAHVHQKHC